MTKPNFTHIVALLDRSGSMKQIQDDTIGGFNVFLDEQKKVPGEATITLIQFSDKYEVKYMDVPLLHVANLTKETYVPGGWTALNDALARTINDVGVKLSNKPESERPSKVVVLIMTDGEENSSKEFAGSAGLIKLSNMVSHQKEKYSWIFSFIGANIDSFATATNYGIDTKNVINYISSHNGTYNAFKSISRGLASSRLSSTPIDFFVNEENKKVIDDSTLDTSNIENTINREVK